ncbi:hypothetical protein I4U23_022892 [Adineta vaga]|nr:hypothetical protein I4U23_022892 [Adineta vaga]
MAGDCSEHIKERLIDGLQLQKIFDLVKSTENHDVVLIWFDESIDDQLKQTIEQLNGHVITCISKDEFLHSINSIQNETMIVIISGKLAVDVLPIIHDNTNIDSIYIFCMNACHYLTLSRNYSKIVEIYTGYDALFIAIKNKIRSLIQQLVTFSLYHQTEKSIRDLSRESPSFLWHQLAKEYLMNMTASKTEAARQEMLDICRIYYQSNPSYLKKIDEFEQTYQPTDALKWYTKDTFLFRILNKSLRSEDIELFYSFRYYIVDLCICLQREYETLKDYLPSMVITLYRGQTLTDEEIKKLQMNINQLIATNGFLSTSWSPEVARVFSANVLYEIKIDLSQDPIDTIHFANISQYSELPNEEEVLIELGATFQILDVQHNGDLWTIKLASVKQEQQIKSEFIDDMKNQITTLAWTEYYFGNLMMNIGQSTKALRYFQDLVQRTTSNHRQQYIAHAGLAHAYVCVGQYDLALNHMLIAHELCTNNMEHIDLGDLAQILFSLGYMYSKQREDELAVDFYTRSIKVLPDQEQNRAKNLIGIADVSFRRRNYDEALASYELALDIEMNFYPRISPHIANDLYHIARCHYYCEEYMLALNYLEQALEIQEQVLPNTHVDIGCTEMYLGKTHKRLGNYESSLKHCTTALSIIEKLLPFNVGFAADLHYDIGLCHAEKNDYYSAVLHYNQSLTFYEEYFPLQDDALAYIYSFMAPAYQHSHQYDLAIEQSKKALKIYQRFPSINIAKIISLLWQLGQLYEQKQDDYSVLRICEQLCSSYEQIIPVDSNQLTLVLKTTAAYHFKLENYHSAIEYFHKALCTEEQSKDIEMAQLYNDLGCCFTKLGQYEMAIKHCSQAQHMLEKYIETNRNDYGKVLNGLARIYYEILNFDQAYHYCLRSLTFVTGKDDPVAVDNYDIIANIQTTKADEQKRKKNLFIKISFATTCGLLIFNILKVWA